MKKVFYFLVVNAVIISSAFQNLSAQEITNQETAKNSTLPSFQLLLSGGFGYASNKEMNDWAKYVADDQVEQYNTLLNSIGEPQDFSAKKDSNANINAGLDLEFRFFSSKNWGLGLGTGLTIAKGKYDVTSPHYSDKIECTASLMTIPLAATLYYVAPLSKKSFFTVGAGAAYYLAFMDIEGMNNEPTPPPIDEPSFLGNTTALGYHIKTDYNYLIGSLSLTGGIRARYVKFKEFKDGGTKLKVDAGLTGIDLYLGIGFAI